MATIPDVATGTSMAGHAPAPPSPAPPTIPLEAPHVEPTAPLPPLGKGVTIDTLLTPTKPDDAQFVHLGSLRVEKTVFEDFKKAERYLAKDPEAVKMLGQLVHDGQQHTIHKIGADDVQGDRFQPNGTFARDHATQSGGDIYWNPTGALRNTDGSATSPAVALVHEQGHSWEWTSSPNGYLRGLDTQTLRFTTAEEQRNERHIEAHVAKTLGEPIRQNHIGEPFEVANPTSRTPVPTPKREFTTDELKRQIDGEVGFYKQHGFATPPAVANGKDAIVPWDGKPHTGSFLQIDEHTAVQHVGRGNYQVYDVNKDLHGKFPPQFESLQIDAHGAFRDAAPPAHEHAQAHGGR